MLFQIKTINGQKTIVPLTADVGTGNPVGTVIVVCSNILPSGYLGLGVQYDITNYPALYQVLGTDTTPTASALGLPTLSSGQYAIKATSGLTENQQENVLNTINENNSYFTTEHATGKKWIDGKPIYRKVIENPTTGVPILTGVDEVIDWKFKRTYSNSQAGLIVNVYNDGNAVENGITIKILNNEVYLQAQSSNFSAVPKWVVIEYTKTTD